MATLAAGLFAQSDFPSLSQKAKIERESDRLEEAAGLYRRALALNPAWAEGWWYLGTILYDREDFEGAALALRKAASLNSRSSSALAMLGLAEAKSGQDPEARKHLQQALSMGIAGDPNLGRVVLYTQGTLLLNAGQFAAAQDLLDRLAGVGEAERELLVALGEAVLGIRPKDRGAGEAADLALSAGQAELVAARRDTRAALEAYTKLAADYPRAHNVQFAYGRFLLANHQDDQAVAAFRKELENSPQHLLARLGIAGILLNSDPAAGLPYAQQAVELAPALEEAHFLLGALLLATKDVNRALLELETARRLDPEDPRVYFRLERAYTVAKRPQEAARARAQFARLNQAKPE